MGLQVVVTEQTLAAAEAARAAGRPTWRISSTVFSQIASDEVGAGCVVGSWASGEGTGQSVASLHTGGLVLQHSSMLPACSLQRLRYSWHPTAAAAGPQVLEPLGPFAAAAGAGAYPPTPAGQQVAEELSMINLKV